MRYTFPSHADDVGGGDVDGVIGIIISDIPKSMRYTFPGSADVFGGGNGFVVLVKLLCLDIFLVMLMVFVLVQSDYWNAV